jgi:hypothetical protein
MHNILRGDHTPGSGDRQDCKDEEKYSAHAYPPFSLGLFNGLERSIISQINASRW